jgi:hypothetical protein
VTSVRPWQVVAWVLAILAAVTAVEVGVMLLLTR